VIVVLLKNRPHIISMTLLWRSSCNPHWHNHFN